MKIMLVGVVASSEIGGRALKFTPEGEAASLRQSQQPNSQTTWLKVTPHCNHCSLRQGQQQPLFFLFSLSKVLESCMGIGGCTCCSCWASSCSKRFMTSLAMAVKTWARECGMWCVQAGVWYVVCVRRSASSTETLWLFPVSILGCGSEDLGTGVWYVVSREFGVVTLQLFASSQAGKCLPSQGERPLGVGTRHVSRVGQNHTYTVYIRYFWQGSHQIYGHARCKYTVLANRTCQGR